MSYRNSIKLLANNFNIVWKQLLYILVVSLIILPITYGISTPIINLLNSEGVIAEFGKIFETIYTKPQEIISAISTALLHLSEILSSHIGDIWLCLLGTALTSVLFFSLLKEISVYNVSSVMYIQMTSFVSIGYTRNMISTLGQSIRFALVKFLCKIPFVVVKTLAVFTYLRLATNWISIFIGLFIVILLLVLLSAIEISLFSGFAGKMLDMNGNISAFKALGKGIAITFKHFTRVFAGAILVSLTILFANTILGVFTLGVALLITIPGSMVFVCIFELTTYFNSKGDRYYLSSTILATPHKDENEKINN